MDIMKIKIWLISAVIICAYSACDDGDLIVTSFDFQDQSLEFCGGEANLVFFKINNEAQESIALQIVGSSEIFLQEDIAPITLSETNFVTYRKFNADVDASYFCSSIPPTSPQVSNEYLAENGLATINNTLTLDDQDGVPEEMERILIGGFLQDTDRDGIPDYYDSDDDGDNVPTRAELSTNNDDGDNDPFTPVRDTDMDGIADYLDFDDDNDGICTRDESTDDNIDPTDDTDENGLPDYLNDQVAKQGFDTQGYILHTYSRTADVQIVLSNLVFSNPDEDINQETLNLGILLNVFNDPFTGIPDYVDGLIEKCN